MSRGMDVSNADLFSHALNADAHDIQALVRLLAAVPRDRRLDALQALRKALKRSGNAVPFPVQHDFYAAVRRLLDDASQRPAVTTECLWLVVDVIPFQPALDSHVAPLLPAIVAFLGHDAPDVRRAALRALHVHMRHTHNLQKCVRAVVAYGLEARDPDVRRGAVVALPLLFTDEFENENLWALADALSRLLVQSDAALFYPVFLALQRLHSVVGNHTFQSYLARMSAESQELYASVLSRNPSADTDDRRDDRRHDESLLEPSLPPKSVSFSSDLRFGFFAPKLVAQAESARTDTALDALHSMLLLVRESPSLAPLLPEVRSFIADFLSQQLNEQNNFKVALTALDIMEVLLDRLAALLTPNADAFTLTLAARIGDSRTVVRDSVIRVLHQSMHVFAPQRVLDLLLVQKPSRNPRVREELVNRVTAAVLTFPRQEFDLHKLCFAVTPLLADSRRHVRLAALESCAVLAQALGPARLSPLLSAAEAIEQSVGQEGLVQAVEARLARRQLPRVATDGTVRYVLNPQSFSGWFCSQSDADLEWVMLGAVADQTRGKAPNGKESAIPLPSGDRRKPSLIPDDREDDRDDADAVEAIGRRKSLAEVNIDHLLTSGQTADISATERPLVSFRAQESVEENQSQDESRQSTQLPVDAEVDGFGAQSPVQSSSAPSTASAEAAEKPFFAPDVSALIENRFEPLERSLSLPSIQTELRVEERPEVDASSAPEPDVTPQAPANTPAPPLLAVEEATPLPSPERATIQTSDVWTQKDDKPEVKPRPEVGRRKRAQPVGRLSRSQSPQSRRRPSRPAQHLYIKTTPAIPLNANIRLILQNVARTEGPFEAPLEASRAALLALQDDAWTTKVEGMLAVTRLATFHANALHKDQHALVQAVTMETRNPRSTVARAAIFALGELFARLGHQVEPEMDAMIAALLAKSADNAVFIREDVERALGAAVAHLPQTRTAIALIQGGATHRNALVRRTCAQFVAQMVDSMGATKCLLGPRDIADHVLPAAARFVQDSSPHTRFFGRRAFALLQTHAAFDKLLRKHVTPGTYRNIVGILESIKRRGAGDRPQDMSSPVKDCA